MNYNEALEYIHGTKKFGSKLGLDNIRELLKLLDNPHRKLKFIHVAGTNGKGSTSSYVTSILSESGYRVGLFTSPYLERFNERIKINDQDISDNRLAEVTLMVKEKVQEMIKNGYNHPTEFEIVTAIAMQFYMEENVDFVVLEVGLGGRYDSTNVIEDSLVSIITTISMDHTDILGDTLGKIASEKAGIIKENGFVVSYPQEEEAQVVISEIARNKNAKLDVVPVDNMVIEEISEYGCKFDFYYKNYTLKGLEIQLVGKHQAFNASTALTAILLLKDRGIIEISEDEIRRGLKKTKWTGRLEVIKRQPTFLIDGAHNIQGIHALKSTIKELFKYKKLILGIGILADKDVYNMTSELVTMADKVIVTEANIFRALKAEELGKIVEKYNDNYIVESNLEKAIDKAFELADEDDLIIFSGSLYLIGDVRRIVTRK